jgi:hypothetical protein
MVLNSRPFDAGLFRYRIPRDRRVSVFISENQRSGEHFFFPNSRF